MDDEGYDKAYSSCATRSATSGSVNSADMLLRNRGVVCDLTWSSQERKSETESELKSDWDGLSSISPATRSSASVFRPCLISVDDAGTVLGCQVLGGDRASTHYSRWVISRMQGGYSARRGVANFPCTCKGHSSRPFLSTPCHFASLPTSHGQSPADVCLPIHLNRRAHTPATCKGLHQTTVRRAITNLEMPAMSPTMTEGGITLWKKREGESFSAGEVLLEIVRSQAVYVRLSPLTRFRKRTRRQST